MKPCVDNETLNKMSDEELRTESRLCANQMLNTSNIFEMEMYEDVLINISRILNERRINVQLTET